jgi:hypothetical protein
VGVGGFKGGGAIGFVGGPVLGRTLLRTRMSAVRCCGCPWSRRMRYPCSGVDRVK